MPISNDQIKLLQSYRDKSYITSILCSQSEEHFSFIKSLVNIPLILSSSVMTILNSLSETNSTDMKYANIILNATTATILSLIGNFKLTEQSTNFKTIGLKMNKLCHKIEDLLTIDLENTSIEHIRAIITEYDNLNENIDFGFPGFIKNRVKRTYEGKKVLPNVLNCELSFISVETSTQNNC
jgi:hypothetical protein